MTHPFRRSGRRLVFAHRGGAGVAPENTLAAFDAGLACGADGLELDVRLSADGVPMVHHDLYLERTTDLTGPLTVHTASELARADAGSRFSVDGAFPFRKRGIGVPTLSETLRRYRDIPMIIELKEDSRALVEAIVAEVRRADAAERVCLGSFSHSALVLARTLAPEIVTSAARSEVRWALYRSRWRWPIRQAPYQAYQVPEVSRGTRVVSARFVADAHALDLPVQVWTVDRVADAQRLLDWGADALITDRPDVIVPFVRSFEPLQRS